MADATANGQQTCGIGDLMPSTLANTSVIRFSFALIVVLLVHQKMRMVRARGSECKYS